MVVKIVRITTLINGPLPPGTDVPPPSIPVAPFNAIRDNTGTLIYDNSGNYLLTNARS